MADVEFNPDATDGDGDGMVQDGTPFERPVDAIVSEETVEEAKEEAEIVEEPVVEEKPKATKKAPAKKKAAPKPTTEAKEVNGGTVIGSAIKEEDDIDALLDKLIADETKNAAAIISSAAATEEEQSRVVADVDSEKVAVFSSRNASWAGNGSVYKGYNILRKKQAEAWLTREHVRLATPAEVAEHLR